MEMVVNVPMLDKQFSVDVLYGDTFKSQRNRSFASASPCCQTELKQEKKCGACAKVIANNEVTAKIIKIGKSKTILPASRLDEIEEQIEGSATDIKVKAVIRRDGFEIPNHRVEGAKYVAPAKKRAKDYVELKELCKTHILVAEATFKANNYEIALMTIDDVLVAVKFATQARMSEKPNLDGVQGLTVNPELLKVESEILDKSADRNYDFTKFADQRQELVDELIEKAAMGELGDLSTIGKPVEASKPADDTSELERLKALLSKK